MTSTTCTSSESSYSPSCCGSLCSRYLGSWGVSNEEDGVGRVGHIGQERPVGAVHAPAIQREGRCRGVGAIPHPRCQERGEGSMNYSASAEDYNRWLEEHLSDQ